MIILCYMSENEAAYHHLFICLCAAGARTASPATVSPAPSGYFCFPPGPVTHYIFLLLLHDLMHCSWFQVVGHWLRSPPLSAASHDTCHLLLTWATPCYLFLLWTWSKPNVTALKWRHCCQSLRIKHKILYEYKNVKIKENEDIMFGHFLSRVYNITRKLIWDNHHHFYSLLSNTLPMACHTTLKMVKSRTHASMFLWFTTGEFLCNDSRLSECGKRETYCWNSPNVSQGISGFFHLLISSGL